MRRVLLALGNFYGGNGPVCGSMGHRLLPGRKASIHILLEFIYNAAIHRHNSVFEFDSDIHDNPAQRRSWCSYGVIVRMGVLEGAIDGFCPASN